MCPGGSTQVWPLTAEGSRVGRSASILCPAPGSLAPFAEKLRRKSILFLEGVFYFFCLAWDCRQISDHGTDTLFWHFCSEVAASCNCPVTRWEFSPIRLAGARQSGCQSRACQGTVRGGTWEGRACTPRPPGPHPHRGWSPFHSLAPSGARRSLESLPGTASFRPAFELSAL